MGRVGALSPSSYWPNSGDQFEDQEEGILWEVVRANTFFDEVSETKFRYCLVLGRHPDFDEAIVMTFSDASKELEEFLLEIQVIHRKKPGGVVPYTWNPSSETWRS